MLLPSNITQAKAVLTQGEIVKEFDEFLKTNNIRLSEEKKFEYLAKIFYFFNNANHDRLTPYFNSELKKGKVNNATSATVLPLSSGGSNSFIVSIDSKKNKKKKNRNNSSNNSKSNNENFGGHFGGKLMTFSKEVNDQYEFGKGNLIPFCKFAGENKTKGLRMEYLISIDFENEIVYANVSNKKLIMGSNKIVSSSYDSGVANYCIPKFSTLVRGNARNLLKMDESKLEKITPNFNSLQEYELAVAKSVIQVSRVDMDSRHGNAFEDLPEVTPEQREILDKYFRPVADAPHFHFCNRDYTLRHRTTDSSAIAINVDYLIDYMADMMVADSNDAIANHSFGTPFVQMKKNAPHLPSKKIKQLFSGVCMVYDNLSKKDQATFETYIRTKLNEQCEKINGKSGNVILADEFREQSYQLINLLKGKYDNSEIVDEINPLTLTTMQMFSFKCMMKMGKADPAYLNSYNIILNDFYNSINTSLNKKYSYKKHYVSDDLAEENQESNFGK